MVSESKEPIFQSDILKAAQKQVLQFFNENHDARLVYHNFQHTIGAVNFVHTIASSSDISKEEIEICQLAAWFSNCGYLTDYKDFLPSSINQATEFLDQKKYPSDKKERVINCLKSLDSTFTPENTEQKLFSDAINAHEMTTGFSDTSPILRLEWELMQHQKLSTVEWSRVQLQRLMNTQFHLPYSKLHYEPSVAHNLMEQKLKVEKNKNAAFKQELQSKPLRKFQAIERKQPNSATQTFFRTNYRNHINLSAIADNKANIMISVNAIMISVLISILSYGNITETKPMILMPVIMFIVSGLTSLIFAVLSARPKVTNVFKQDMTPEEAQKNIVFFGNFVNLDLNQYEEAMDAMFRDSELIYGNMTRDMYFLGKVLDKKYRYLGISYNIFMVGFVTTVLMFLYTLFG